MSSEPDAPLSVDEKNKRVGKILVSVIVVMTLFAFASIPLYQILCTALDPGGSSYSNGETDEYVDVTVDKIRTVRLRFAANVNKQLPWDFYPMEGRVEVHPGERRLVKFYAKNIDSLGSITGKAVYDINPPEAGQYFKKIECFCFQEQELAAGEDIEMPLVFWFDSDMPADIKEITLAYTFFNMDSSFERTVKKREENKVIK